MAGLIVRRLLQLPLILLVIYTLTLTLAWAIPGNPLENPEGRQPPQEVIDQMKAQYNLDSFWKFYATYLDNATGLKWMRGRVSGRHAAQDRAAAAQGVAAPTRYIFDLGPSLHYKDQR
ncbi:MAG: hypothetical protein IIB55_05325, partial [Planctomycetes bacterium]|nr:hypothetical protein [Planctomycetota bacterium]